MNTAVELGTWEALREQAQAIRYQVFVVEQGVPVELEWDDMDALCLHAVASDASGRAVGTGRLLPDGHIGRMAVLPEYREAGIGGAILRALMKAARTRGDHAVVLNAQVHAQGFYARCGFVAEGEVFMEAGIPHQTMRHEFAR